MSENLISKWTPMIFWLADGPYVPYKNGEHCFKETSYKKAYARVNGLYKGQWWLHWFDRKGNHRCKKVFLKLGSISIFDI